MTDSDAISILLVEDDPIDARLLLQLLDHADVCDYTIRSVGTAADAERTLLTERHDVVLLDISLPDCDGVASVFRILTVAPDTPVVVLTGRDDYALGIRSIEAGAQDFLVKGEVKGNPILRCAQWAIARGHAAASTPSTDARWGALDRTDAAIALIDHELKVVTANPTFVEIVGREEDELARVPLTELIEVDDIVGFVLDLRSTLRGEEPTRLCDVEMRSTPPLPVTLSMARVASHDEGGSPLMLLVMTPR